MVDSSRRRLDVDRGTEDTGYGWEGGMVVSSAGLPSLSSSTLGVNDNCDPLFLPLY